MDFVYTWVDGSDPEYQARLARWSSDHEVGARPLRFANHDELRFSLRSVVKYAPWFDHIYLVTYGQKPEWLNSEAPRLTLISHDEIFEDARHLPTFNSFAIEHQLHRIPNLSETFLKFDDDFFFLRPTDASWFLNAQGELVLYFDVVYVPPSGARVAEGAGIRPVDISTWEGNYLKACQHTAKLFDERHGYVRRPLVAHIPYAMRRSVIEALHGAWPDAIAQTLQSRFRMPTDMPLEFAHSQFLLHARDEVGQPTYPHRRMFASHVDFLALFDMHSDPDEVDREIDRALHNDCRFLCVQTQADTDEATARRFRERMTKLFPEPSPFERPGRTS